MRSRPSPEGKAPAKRRVAPVERATSLLPHEGGKLRHDLNNKLGIILAHCELMSVQASIDSATAKHLSEIEDAARSIADMVGVQQRKRLQPVEPPESK